MNARRQSPGTRRIGYLGGTDGYAPAEQARRRELLEGPLPPHVSIAYLSLPDAPRFLDRPQDFDDLLGAAERRMASVASDGVDVLVTAGAIDPGLADLRLRTVVPLIGPGEASLAIGAALGRPLSIVTVDRLAVTKARDFVDATRAKPPIASVRSMDCPVRTIVGDPDAGRAALARACREAVERDGAMTIMLGSMTLGALGLDDRLRRELGVPVINPIEAAVAAALACLQAMSPGPAA